jgi:small subunit ribosomal protein S30e
LKTFFFLKEKLSLFIIQMGKVHGGLARAGKVRGQTPKVPKAENQKKKRGRALKRLQFNKRCIEGKNANNKQTV